MSETDKPNGHQQNNDIVDAEVIESSVEDIKPTPAEAPTETVKPDTTTAKQSGSKIAIAAVLISLIAIAGVTGAGYWGKLQLAELNTAIDKKLSSQQLAATAALTDSQTALAELNESFQQIQAEKASQTVEIAALQERLSDAIKQVEAGRNRSENDWRLAEAEYLLRLANQRVLMEKRAEGALALLKNTDQIIKELDDVSLYALRQALASDIAKLEALPKLDVEGTYLRLTALIEQTKDLPTLSLEQQRQLPELLNEMTSNTVTPETQAAITSGFAKALAKLESLVVIQQHDKPVEPILSPDQGHYLRQNIQLLLEQGQLALLRQQSDIYKNSLTRAQTLLEQYFDKTNTNTAALLRALSQLSKLEVAPTIPDISGSLKQLQSHMKEMAKLRAEAN
ncbi:uroporphyrinogen-III C-methyltransferase [Marinobacterium sp. LSUCC0821]|jgi:uroporphyrin-3 C-methyltransferase|uniref:uroporphyrinogen-III C-methyltransferase n=1 Tax=Marinobacterium sp. LSUCC0821 TaxID=2668067 RepID=UPI00145294AD|nr:uroporphyrinogen-III C-methyltransferase [Marinobacterium sp. LSUCC0821]QJD71629.1 heme biosynthesis protein [Marinobacterium sp. LSUCC0821]